MSSSSRTDEQNSIFDKPLPEAVGKLGESIALGHLIRKNYRIVMTNFSAPIGRNRRGAIVNGEIDIVALDSGILCFVEVKSRTVPAPAHPLLSIDLRKQRQVIRTARAYRRMFDVLEMRYRYDAVGVLLDGQRPVEVKLLRGFWTERKYRGQRWFSEAGR